MTKLADYHLHSSFSHDSDTEPSEIVEAAIKAGLSEICFTEHKDFADYYKWRDFYEDEPYTGEFEILTGRYRNKIKIKKGVEIDFQSDFKDKIPEFVRDHYFDFIIGSVHALNGEFIENSDYFKNHDPHEVYAAYFKEVLELSKLDVFDVIGHLDYIKRFGNSSIYLDPLNYKDLLDEIFKNLIKNKKGIELNCAGFRHGLLEPYPSINILKMYKEAGGEIITIGSDAHKPSDVGRDIEKGILILSEIGFSNIYKYNDRMPEKIDISG